MGQVFGVEVRLDVDYDPTPERPEWVAAVEERYADALNTPIQLKEITDFGGDGELAVPVDPYTQAMAHAGPYWDDRVDELGADVARNLMNLLTAAGFDEETEWLSQISVADKTKLARLWEIASDGRIDEAEFTLSDFAGALPDGDFRQIHRAIKGAWRP